ncbi:hypothetical protein GSI_10338 [Ganoderma sinense ZZ0214-1]|uniref:Uncharacterized protein n=1 Tax=Ganoderma sinense ZZ0214-1 TaxID=1077348 RepID=A0A2G8S0B6_9APHY|nr:hypothetical protein GSI_10338 [Ganoderma sinense ZZ0214-1]
MSSLAFNTSPTLAFPEKFRPRGLDSEVRDPLARPSPSFDWADDVEQEFYSAGDSDDSQDDEGAVSLEIESPLSSGARSFRGSGFPLTAISEDEEEEEDTTPTDSADARGLLDTDRMFSSGHPTTRGHRGYRVASVPSLWAIKEEDEDSDGESLSDANSTVPTSDSFRSSLTCIAADDSDSGWVWVNAEEARKAPVSSTDARPRRARLWIVSWFKAF